MTKTTTSELPVAWADTDIHPELPGEELAAVTVAGKVKLIYNCENPDAWIQGRAVEVGE